MTGRDLIPAPAPPLEGELLAPNPTPAEFVDAIVRQCEDALDLERGDLMRPPPIDGEVVGPEPRRLSLQDWAEENSLGVAIDIVTESPPCQNFSIPVTVVLPEYTREATRAAFGGCGNLPAFCGCGCLLKPLDRECPACGLPT